MTTLDHINEAPDPSSVSMMPTAIRYGLIGGLASIIFGTVMNILGMGAGTGNDTLNSVISLVIFAAVIYLALTKHRDEDLGGFMSYGRGLGLGVLTSLIMGVLASLFTYIYVGFIDPSITEVILERTLEQYEEMGMPEDQIEMSMSWVKSMMSPIGMATFQVIGSAIMGFIASLIISAVVKKNPPEYA